ncbi:hypothetical protein GF362_01040 [Candidatus Dojkabacteria bacterium]|nr:hypothetical protein [Candidatus Dojkabacteria bacterium]
MDVSKLPKKVRIIILIVIGVLVLACGVIYLLTKEKYDPEVLEERKSQMQEMYTKLGKIYNNFPSEEELAETVACDDSAIKEKVNHERETVPYFEHTYYEYLSRFGSGSIMEDDSLDWINSNSFSQMKELEEIDTMIESKVGLNSVEELNQDGHVVVFYPFEVYLPEITEDGDTYYIGSYDGALVVFDYEEAKPVCHTTFSVESSPTIKVSEGKLTSEDEKTIMKDFKENFGKEVKKAIEEISSEIKLSKTIWTM